jgi:hypothetical protein
VQLVAAVPIVRMPNYMRLQSSSGNSSGGADQLDTGTIEETPTGQSFFSPLQSVVGFDGIVHGSFDAYIANLPPRTTNLYLMSGSSALCAY